MVCVSLSPRARASIIALVVLIVALQVTAVFLDSPSPWITYACYMLLSPLGIFYCFRAAARGPQRTTWLLVGVGYVGMQISSTGLGLAGELNSRALFWVGCAGGLVMYLGFALAAIAIPAQRLQKWQRAGLAGEAIAILGCGFMYVWYFVLRPHLEGAIDWSRWPLTFGYPLGDLLLLIGVTAVVLRGGLQATVRPQTLLTGGLALFLLADTAFNAIGDDGNHVSGPITGTLPVVLATLSIAVAAMWQAHRTDQDGEGGPGLRLPWGAAWFTYLPYVAVVLGLGLMIAVILREDQLRTWGGLVLGLVAVTAGVAMRQVVAVRESQQHETTDPVTGLANRAGLDRLLTRALRRDEPVAVMLIDLDGFKSVNDTYGNSGGDRVLLAFADVLRQTLRGSDIAARVGGDEFIVVQRDVAATADVVALARRVLAAAATSPVNLGEHSVTTRASIGAAVARPGETADDLRHRADIAVYRAKRAGQHDVVVHEPGMLDRRADDAALGRDLEHAIDNAELLVLYQPMIDLGTGRPRGVEALVRWNHPVRGMVSPLDFIPIAESTGLIIDIGRHVLEEAAREVRSWPEEVYASVNLSPRQLQDPELVPDVLAVLGRTGLAPHRLVLEITESAVVDDQVALPALERLRAHGIRIAIDDFGTGYSSLQYLSRLPIDILKIDRSFVGELDGTGRGSAIAEAVIRLAQILGLTTVAEGIETPEQANELRELGCETAQGYLYAKPMPPADARAFVTAPPVLEAPPAPAPDQVVSRPASGTVS
jgi:diguanylate cyclase